MKNYLFEDLDNGGYFFVEAESLEQLSILWKM